MPKKTVSLPEHLCVQLDEYAAAHSLPVSQVAQQALESFFGKPPTTAQPHPTPEPRANEHTAARLEQVERYISGLSNHVAMLRNFMAAHLNPFDQPPGMYPPPPWFIGRE